MENIMIGALLSWFLSMENIMIIGALQSWFLSMYRYYDH